MSEDQQQFISETFILNLGPNHFAFFVYLARHHIGWPTCQWDLFKRKLELSLGNFSLCNIGAGEFPQVTIDALADPTVGRGTKNACPSSQPNFFHFMQFSAKILANNWVFTPNSAVGIPVWEILDPPLTRLHKDQGNFYKLCGALPISSTVTVHNPFTTGKLWEVRFILKPLENLAGEKTNENWLISRIKIYPFRTTVSLVSNRVFLVRCCNKRDDRLPHETTVIFPLP